jgi:hypothetical protein
MAYGEYGWAFELLVKGFEQRIQAYLTEDRIKSKIREQATYSDEFYEAMLSTAAGRKHFVSMMTYWSVGQGIAVSLRNWVEELIAELVVHPNRKGAFGKAIAQAYTLKELNIWLPRTRSPRRAKPRQSIHRTALGTSKFVRNC